MIKYDTHECIDNIHIMETLKFTPHRALVIPHATHGYSMALNYITQWFIDHFPDNYFNGIFLSSKNISDEYRTPIFEKVVREPPMLAINPIINYDYDRDRLDLYMGTVNQIINNFRVDSFFFNDPIRSITVGVACKELELAVRFSIMVRTRPQQQNLKDQMDMIFRIGFTEMRRPTLEYNIPKIIIYDIANQAGFNIDKQGKIENINVFLRYMNQYSSCPIIHKMHGLNGQEEFFMRVGNVCARMNLQDKLELDEGQMKSKDVWNYFINMNVMYHIMTPKFFLYGSSTDTNLKNSVYEYTGYSAGLFSICVIDPPKSLENGWTLFLSSGYDFDEEEYKQETVTVNIEELFSRAIYNPTNNTKSSHQLYINRLIKESISQGLSPSSYIEIRIYTGDTNGFIIPSVDWKTYNVTFSKNKIDSVKFAIYVDKSYLNSRLV